MAPQTAFESFLVRSVPRHATLEWVRVVLGWTFLAALWFRSLPAVLLILGALVASGLVHPPVRRPERFMTRAVDGYRIWMHRMPRLRRALLLGGGLVLGAVTVWALWTHQTILALGLVAFVVVLKGTLMIHFARIADATDYDPRVGPEV